MIGHSLGSLILFDLLSHQIREVHSSEPPKETQSTTESTPVNRSESLEDFLRRVNLIEYQSLFEAEKITSKNLVSLIFIESLLF